MLHGIGLTNFRAFKEQNFEFKKLNVFIGKNNSGKSSALSALNVICQTILHDELDGTPLLLNGLYDKLGTYIDVVNGNHPRRKMGFDVSFDEYRLRIEYKYRTQRRQIELVLFDLRRASKQIFKYEQRKDSFDLQLKGQTFERIFKDVRKRRPTFRNFWPMLGPAIRSQVRGQSADEDYALFREIDHELFRARQRLYRHFQNYDSVSPFRDKPQRTYLYSGESASKIGITGSNMATMLAADASRRGAARKNLAANISEWFSYTGIAKSVSVESISPRHFELCLTSNDGTKHNLCDVGFGCSQVLPVLVGGLNLFHDAPRNSGRVFVVQEPEIHLHPNAQAALGSFFVNLVSLGGQIFIETHSDNLVLRIARHIALGHISADDVAIFYVQDIGDDRVTEISISDTGTFGSNWPEGFFPQRQTESLLLARAGLEARKRDVSDQLTFRYPEMSK